MIPDDQLRIIIAMTISMPLSYLLRFIKGKFQREMYSFALGTLLQYYVFGSDLIYVFMLHALVYAICWGLPKRSGAICTTMTILILSGYHIYRLIVDYGSWNMDISNVLMTMVCKYSLFAYAVQDGTVKDQKKLSQQSLHCRVKQLPSILSYLGYCQFLPTAVIGTAFQYQKYKDFIEQNGYFKDIPAPWKRMGKDIGYSLVLGAIFFVLGQMVFPLSTMKKQSYTDNSFFYIFFFSFFSVTFLKFKYYFAWKYSMGAVHAAGISYQEYTIKDTKIGDFKGIQTCNPWIVETSKHMRQKINNWNMSVQLWLRRCIYERANFKSKATSQLFTFMVSAFWHGFYGGYYFSFFFWFCQSHLQNLIYKISKNPDSPYVKTYRQGGFPARFVLWIGANLLFSVNGVYFQVLTITQGIKILLSLYCLPPLIIIGLIAIFTLLPGKKPRSKTDSNSKKEQDISSQKAQLLTSKGKSSSTPVVKQL